MTTEEIQRMERAIARIEAKVDRLETATHDNGTWIAALLGAVVGIIISVVWL